MLVFIKCEDQISEDRLQVGRELRPSIFLESCKSAATSFLDPFVVVKDHTQELASMSRWDVSSVEMDIPLPLLVRRIGSCDLRRSVEYTNWHNGQESSK